MISVKPLSFSAIKEYEQCPYKYYNMKYHADKYPYKQGAEAARGERIHKEFEDYIKHNKPLETAVQWQSFMTEIDALDGTKHTEYKMAIDWQANKTAYFKGKNIWLRGQCDLLVDFGKSAIILDYKTGKSKYADTGQLKMMSMMAFIHFPKIEHIEAGLMFVDEDKCISASYERSQQQEYLDHWFSRSAEIVKSVNNYRADIPTRAFPQRNSVLCGWCSVTDCPYYTGEK